MKLTRKTSLQGEVTIPGDKSISHRAIMFGALADGTTKVTNFLQGADCLSTISCFEQMGISIKNNGDNVVIQGKGLHGLQKPREILNVGNSGTTLRLMSGILSAQHFDCDVTGDSSICRRPMNRIITPLSTMGASLESIKSNGCAPIHITGRKLSGVHYNSPIASAQVKSSVLLAGLYADGPTSITEPYVSRNHSELMLRYFGAEVTTEGTTVTILPPNRLKAADIHVPGDISSATYFIVAGLITPNSSILIKDVGINPTRDGIIKVCQQMGGKITILNKRMEGCEPVADIHVETSELKGITIGGSIIPTLIDEIPAITVLACFAQGTTTIKDASELKVKESNRIDVCVTNLSNMGASIEGTEDGMIIHGGNPLHGAVIDSKLDHRIAMSFTIAGMNASGVTTIEGADCVTISYPNFYNDINQLCEE